MHKGASPSPLVARFIIGFLFIGAVMTFVNLLPYLHSRGAYQSDGYEIIGFPLIFHRAGGLAYINDLYPVALLADIALGFAIALATGYVCTRVSAHKLPQSPNIN